jgi:hypothetical protein
MGPESAARASHFIFSMSDRFLVLSNSSISGPQKWGDSSGSGQAPTAPAGGTTGAPGAFTPWLPASLTARLPAGWRNARADVADLIDKGRTDAQILEELLKERGAKVLPPHMMP